MYTYIHVCNAIHRFHTLALVKSSGKVYSFGLGENGQLGRGQNSNTATPTPVQGSWLSMDSLPDLEGGSSVDPDTIALQGWVVKRICAGGHHSFAAVVVPGKEVCWWVWLCCLCIFV